MNLSVHNAASKIPSNQGRQDADRHPFEEEADAYYQDGPSTSPTVETNKKVWWSLSTDQLELNGKMKLTSQSCGIFHNEKLWLLI